MTTPAQTDRSRAANHRRAWIRFGAFLLVCSVLCYPVILAREAAKRAAIRRAAPPGMIICFAPDPLQEAGLWACGINTLAAIGIVVRGLMIRLPAA